MGLCFGSSASGAEIKLLDDKGHTLVLPQPARRIISLAPHVTELLFAAGAGDRVVGVVDYSDYPEAAKKITNVGSHSQLDLERIVSLKPDLIVVWLHGNSQKQLEKLLSLGIPVYYNEPRRLEGVATSIEQFGRIAGTEAVATKAARAFMARVADLRARYAGLPPVPLFYQVWKNPLMTVNGSHIISHVITMCGGRNIFAELKPLAPSIAEEAVLAADPEVIGTAAADPKDDGLDRWRKWRQLKAVQRGNLFVLHPDQISRHTPRILDGAQQICEHLGAARAKGGK
jgi:iron complex transport system substrate-binding protein